MSNITGGWFGGGSGGGVLGTELGTELRTDPLDGTGIACGGIAFAGVPLRGAI